MPGDSTKRYPLELRERAVRMVAELAAEQGSQWAAMTRVAELLGVGTVGESGRSYQLGSPIVYADANGDQFDDAAIEIKINDGNGSEALWFIIL